MKLGLWAPRGGKADEGEIDDPYRFSIDMVRQAEAMGFATTLVAQRYLGPDLDAWVLASALAPQTETIELLVAIHPGMINPQVVAKMGATLDQISAGRFAVNLVNGWDQQEINTFANGGWLDRSEARYQRMDEFIQVVKGMWADGPFTFAGEHFAVEGIDLPAKPIQKPPPFYAASRSEVGKDIIAKRCEEWFVLYEAGHRNFEANLAVVARDVADMRGRAARHGRTLGFGVSVNIVCEDSQAAAERLADAIEEGGRGMHHGRSSVLALGAGLVGTPETIAERMRRYQEVGVECFMIRFPNMREGLQAFGEGVVPLLGAAAPQRDPALAGT